MRFLRAAQLAGTILLVIAVPYLIFEPNSRPALRTLGIVVAIGAGLGLACALALRYTVPLEKRLELFRSLSPRLARRLIPSRKDGNNDQ